MIITILVVFGLILGSFVNALVWRLRQQELSTHKPAAIKAAKTRLSLIKAKKLAKNKQFSIVHGRSMCPNCRHQLAGKDLVPVLSWLSVAGKCRYCKQAISLQYPIVELVTAALFVVSYLFWPVSLHGGQLIIFTIWLLLLVGFMALTVYDLRWFLLPNRIMYPLGGLASLLAFVRIVMAAQPLTALIHTLLAVAVGGGIFYLLFQISAGKWIGGGDVKLGWLLGLVVAEPANSLLVIFLAALGGSLISLPLLITGRLKRSAVIPFGPFLIAASVVTVLFGANILHWYRYTLLTI